MVLYSIYNINQNIGYDCISTWKIFLVCFKFAITAGKPYGRSIANGQIDFDHAMMYDVAA